MNDIEHEIMAAMRTCIDENEEVLQQRCEDAAQRTVRELKQQSRKRSGKYARGWTHEIDATEAGIDCTVHNRQYQLTHLLENDHKIKNQTGQSYGTAKGDKIIADVADRNAAGFISGGDAT